MTVRLKRCSFGGCRAHVAANVRYCATHRRIRGKYYGAEHRATREKIMAQHGWACFYCGDPVTLSDDIAHLSPTQKMSPVQAARAPRVPAHRKCHNRHAPHL